MTVQVARLERRPTEWPAKREVAAMAHGISLRKRQGARRWSGNVYRAASLNDEWATQQLIEDCREVPGVVRLRL